MCDHMKPNDLDIPKQFADILAANIKELNPVQISAVKAGLLNLKDSFVVAAPTASGKTLLAELISVKAILEKHCKVIYVVPLRALASEKYERFKACYEKLGIKVAISSGDFDSTDNWLENYDLIVLTSEKADSLLRHRANFMTKVGVAVIDECHLITDSGRGPTLEVAITRLKKLNPNVIFLMLSATIANSQELADWIGAKLVKSDWRPVKLHQGILYDNKVWFEEHDSFELDASKDLEPAIAAHTVNLGKQAIIFASTRRSAEAIAERCCNAIKSRLNASEKAELAELAEKVRGSLDSATPQCKRLALCISSGTAFHHAGLVAHQRQIVERAFRDKKIKLISATPTLAAGVDLPAYRVLIRDAKRYYSGTGYVYIPTLEYQQMAGRAGRPSYDTEGEAILIAKSEAEGRELYNRFVLGAPEEITSKLAAEPILRTHTLALLASEVAGSEKDLLDFFQQTFWAHQYKDIAGISKMVNKLVNLLLEWNFITKKDDYLIATKIGQRVAELYIDPLTAHEILVALANRKEANEFGVLHLISNTSELAPPLRIKKSEYDSIMAQFAAKEQYLLTNIPKEWEIDYDDFIHSFKTALVFEDWSNEKTEDQLYTKYGITPGELHSKREIADWLLYSVEELSRLLNRYENMSLCRKLRLKLHYGIGEELLQLVKLKGIGRVRARKLYNAKYRTIADLKKAKVIDIAHLIGLATAENVLKQISDSNSNTGAVV